MFTKIRWRLAIPYLSLILIVMGGLFISLSRPTCVANIRCSQRSILIATLLLIIVAGSLAAYLSERTAQPVSQLTQLIQHINEGDLRARLLLSKRDEVGNLIRAFNALMETLEAKITDLSHKHQQLNTAIQYTANGVLIVDELSHVQLINPAACALLHTTQQSAISSSFAEVARHHQFIELWQQCRDKQTNQTATIEIGRDLFIQATVTPFHQEPIQGYLIILQDLTTIRRLETVRRDFISNISHELRTPLASLRSVVETLQNGALTDPPAAEYFLSLAHQEVDTLTQMVAELLELSRIESGQVPFRYTPTAVSDLMLPPVERLQPQAKRQELNLILDVPAKLPRVSADETRMQQVITNLLYNAIKFTPPGGTITIKAKLNKVAQSQTKQLIITIHDTGIGIPKEDIPRIFERFYKSDQARTRGQGGTGLGLAIARHIVEAHNGRIWVKSKEGKGSTFFFSLPAIPDQHPTNPL